MEEKIIILGQRHSFKKLFAILLIVGLALSLLMFVGVVADFMEDAVAYASHAHTADCAAPSYLGTTRPICRFGAYESAASYAMSRTEMDDVLGCVIPLLLSACIGLGAYFALRNTELIVTNQRICGIPAGNKKIAVPFDSVTSTTVRGKHTLVIRSYAKSFVFFGIKNADEVYKTINHLQMQSIKEKRQPITIHTHHSFSTPAEALPAPVAPPTKKERLSEVKDMYRRGFITRREYKRVKSTLIGK